MLTVPGYSKLDHGSSVGFSRSENRTWQHEDTGVCEGELYTHNQSGFMMQLDPESDSVVGSFPPPRSGKASSVGCPVCGKVFSAYGSMLDHKAAIHDNVSYVCVCGKTYKYKPGLRRHKQTCQVLSITRQSMSHE